MSFILDALKKSESERHRQSGPVLMDVRIAPPRRRIPTWAWVIAAVLLVNLAVLAWLLWLSPAHRAAPDTAPLATAPAAAPVIPAAAPATAPPAASVPAVVAPAGVAPTGVAPPDAAAPALITGAAPGTPAGIPAAQNIDVSTLPRVADMLAAGVALPELRLSLHVYDAAVQSRYVLLNGSRLREGDSTSEGVRVVAIAPNGVVLEWRGRRMFLGAGG